MQQAVHDRDDEYGLLQARGGEINTHPRMCEQGAACARSAVDIWGSAWASHVYMTSVGKGLNDFIPLFRMRCTFYMYQRFIDGGCDAREFYTHRWRGATAYTSTAVQYKLSI